MSMDAVKTESTLQSFNKYVIQQARTNLTKGRHNVDKKLYNSLKGFISVAPRSFSLAFEMEDYGKFQDLGVKGKFSSTKAPNSPFKFGSGTGQKGGLTNGIVNWVTKKRFQFKDRQTGKFLSYKETANLISRSIYRTGIKPTEFFSKPFNNAFKKLPDDLIEAYGLDVETFLQYTINNGKKS